MLCRQGYRRAVALADQFDRRLHSAIIMRMVGKDEIPCPGHGGVLEERLNVDPFEVGIAPAMSPNSAFLGFGSIEATLCNKHTPRMAEPTHG